MKIAVTCLIHMNKADIQKPCKNLYIQISEAKKTNTRIEAAAD